MEGTVHGVAAVDRRTNTLEGRQLNLSDTMYLSISFRKSTPPQNRQPVVLISISKQ